MVENPLNKQLRPNTLWFPYYPWVAYARGLLRHQKGLSLPVGVADKVLLFFEWRKGSHHKYNLKHEDNKSSSFWAPEPFCHPPLKKTRNDITYFPKDYFGY